VGLGRASTHAQAVHGELLITRRGKGEQLTTMCLPPEWVDIKSEASLRKSLFSGEE